MRTKSKKYTEDLFLAVELPRFARERIMEARKTWRKQLAEDVRWLPAQSLFLPLRHLGEIPVSKSKQLSGKLQKLCAELPLIQLAVDKIEAEPTKDEARFVFLAMERSEELNALRTSIDAFCRELALEKSAKPVERRIALSKNSEPQKLPTLDIKKHLKGFKAKELSLVETRPGPKGPTYRTLKKFPLQSAPPGASEA